MATPLYKNLSTKQRAKIRNTYGIPVNDPYALHKHEALKNREPSYTLDFESATKELDIALNIGLESYGSGRASWMIPAILKGNNNNKQAAMWQLYISEVVGACYTAAQVNKAWHKYTKQQQEYIRKKVDEYLDSCLDDLMDGA